MSFILTIKFFINKYYQCCHHNKNKQTTVQVPKSTVSDKTEVWVSEISSNFLDRSLNSNICFSVSGLESSSSSSSTGGGSGDTCLFEVWLSMGGSSIGQSLFIVTSSPFLSISMTMKSAGLLGNEREK